MSDIPQPTVAEFVKHMKDLLCIMDSINPEALSTLFHESAMDKQIARMRHHRAVWGEAYKELAGKWEEASAHSKHALHAFRVGIGALNDPACVAGVHVLERFVMACQLLEQFEANGTMAKVIALLRK